MSEKRAGVAVISMHASPLGALGRRENGGMNLTVRSLCEFLAERGVPSDVFTRREDPAEPAEELIARTSRLVRLGAGPPRPLPKAELSRWLPDFTEAMLEHARSEGRGYRLVHSHYWLSGLAGEHAAHAWGVPWAHSFHTLARVKSAVGLPAEPERAAAEQHVVRGADLLVAMSAAERAELITLYAADAARISVVRPGVRRQGVSDLDVQELRRALGLEDRRAILFAGRLEPLKGADLLLRAVAELTQSPQFGDVVLLVAGDNSGDGEATPYGRTPGGELGRLRALAAECGIADRVRFLGAASHSQLQRLYRLAELCVVPSLTESFGLVALEAQAAGTPVIAAAVGGLREVVVDGRTGYLVRGRRPTDYARRMAEVLRDSELRRRLGTAARAWAGEFTWERSARQLEEAYERLGGLTRAGSRGSRPSFA